MTLAMNIKGKDCVVMAADSRENHSIEGKFVFYNDSHDKIFILPNNFVISFSGTTSEAAVDMDSKKVVFRKRDIRNIIYDLEKDADSKSMNLQQTINYVLSKFTTYCPGYTSQIHIGGCQQGKLFFEVIYLEQGQYKDKLHLQISDVGWVINGSANELTWECMKKIAKQEADIKPEDFRDHFIAKKNGHELIEFADNVIKEVIRANGDKEIDKQDIGGNIDIVIITREETKWVRA